MIRSLMVFCYRLLRYRPFRVFRFSFYRNYDIKKSDDQLLLTRLCYEGHHLEKAVKNDYSETRGKDRAILLEKIAAEVAGRNLGRPHLIHWAETILAEFAAKQERKKMALPQPVDIVDDDLPVSNPDIVRAISNRRSVRFWRPEPVDRESIEKIVEAGMNGPLACNRQALRVGLFENESDTMVLGTAANKSMLSKAPLILYVAVDRRLYYEKYAAALDAGSFCANALLAVEAFGLGGCWMYQCETADQKKYDALRAYYLDEMPATKTAAKFGYTPAYFKKIRSEFC
ncbi:MAG: hypothetical protein GY950_08580, partial [bacterium]|nr:hypothetical protein [bacterium]